ncbi:hypothetical protein E6B08_17080 [Pseudomonas putida]|uniref:Uncharacterized protein n=1 Tax=Pseudomonas putida TaxID=303 RepID=A0A4D6XFA3_PSEPU|nr:hypothetical protein E6B08_17080 [Pseudomonas putida]
MPANRPSQIQPDLSHCAVPVGAGLPANTGQARAIHHGAGFAGKAASHTRDAAPSITRAAETPGNCG